jgi:tetratricopeptide (TPR) repeat protein
MQRFVSGHAFRHAEKSALHEQNDSCHSESGKRRKFCHSEPAAKPGEEAAFQTGRAYFLIALVSMLSFSAAIALAETPQSLLAAGRVDQALQTLEHQTAPTAESYNLICRAHFEVEAWDAAIPACEKAVSLASDNSVYHLWLGRAYGEKADRSIFFKAIGLAKKLRAEFERSVELDPSNWQARTDLAEFYLEAPAIVGGGRDKARAQAAQLMPLNPAIAHWVSARIAEKENDPDAAEREYHAAIDASHGGAFAWLNLAGFYRHANRLDEMEQALHTMESRPLDRPGALVDGASLLLRTSRDYPMAIRLLRRYIDSSATVEESPVFKAHYMLGEVFEKQGNRPAAAEEYRAALSMAHSFTRAQDALKRIAH